METKHTPGPWAIVGDDEAAGHPFIEVGAGQLGTHSFKTVCEVSSTLDEDTNRFCLTAEDRANAALIAAAPLTAQQRDELLAASIALMGWLNNADTIRRFENNNDFRIAVQSMRAAIARATGGQS